MPRDDDEESGTSRAIRAVGHAASGGHASRGGVSRSSPMARSSRRNWDNWEGPEGGDMPYTYQEYPKHVRPFPDDPRRFVVVNSAEEEAEAMKAAGVVVREDDERKRLLAIGEVKGLKLDKRWSLDNMKAAIIGAGHDPTLNPFA